MTDFNTLIDHHEMGQAYVRITAQDGPSRQLLAFINYDAIQKDGIGLESFDAGTLHQQALAEIESDESIGIACESFGGRLASGLTRVKNAVTFNKHAKDLAKFQTNKLESKSSSIYVDKHSDFERFLSVSKEAMPILSWVLKNIPRTHNFDDWEAFAKKNVTLGRQDEFSKKASQIRALKSKLTGDDPLPKVDYNEGGWSPENFKAAIAAYFADLHKTTDSFTVAGSIISDMEDLIAGTAAPVKEITITTERDKDNNLEKRNESSTYKARTDNVVALRAMNKAFNVLYAAYLLADQANRLMRKNLEDVAHHHRVVD